MGSEIRQRSNARGVEVANRKKKARGKPQVKTREKTAEGVRGFPSGNPKGRGSWNSPAGSWKRRELSRRGALPGVGRAGGDWCGAALHLAT